MFSAVFSSALYAFFFFLVEEYAANEHFSYQINISHTH